MTCLVTLEHVAEKVFLYIELALYNVFVYRIFLHHLLWWQSLSYQQTWLFWNSLWWYLGSLWAQSAFLFPRQARMSKSPSSSHWYKAILVFHLESKSNLIMYVSIIVHFPLSLCINIQLTRRSEGGTSNNCRKALEALRTFSSVESSSVPVSKRACQWMGFVYHTM